MCLVGYKFRTFMQQNKTPNSSAHLACAIHMRDRRLFWSLWFWVWRYHIVVASHVDSNQLASWGLTILSFQWVGNRTGYPHGWIQQTLADTIRMFLVKSPYVPCRSNPHSCLKFPICAVGEVLLVAWIPKFVALWQFNIAMENGNLYWIYP